MLEGDSFPVACKSLDNQRQTLLRQRDAAGPTIDLSVIREREERIVEARRSSGDLLGGLKDVDAKADDGTPFWRFAVKVVIRVYKKLA